MNEMATTITVTNQKGGTGKTTTALYIAYGLAQKQKQVLLIDLDQQADASFSMHTKYDPSKTSFELLTDKASAADSLVRVNGYIDLIPASSRLSTLDVELTGQLDPQFILKDKLKPIIDRYDYVVLDTPPSLNMAVLNALTASQTVVVPTQADIYSLKGLGELATTVQAIKRRSNPDLYIAGILIGRYNARTVFSQAVSNALSQDAAKLQTRVFKSKIREAIAVKEAQNAFKSIWDYEPHAKVTQDVDNFINELLEVLSNHD